MAAVEAGGDRQILHEKIRQHSQAAAARVKTEGRNNDLLERLRQDHDFARLPLDQLLDPQSFVGRSAEQVVEYLEDIVRPLLARYSSQLDDKDDLRV